MKEWIIENKEWLFSGVLITIPITLIGWYISRKKKKNKTDNNLKMSQKSGNNSINLQSGNSIEVIGNITNGSKSKIGK